MIEKHVLKQIENGVASADPVIGGILSFTKSLRNSEARVQGSVHIVQEVAVNDVVGVKNDVSVNFFIRFQLAECKS